MSCNKETEEYFGNPQAWTHRLAPPGWPNSQVHGCQVTLEPQGPLRSPAVGLGEGTAWGDCGEQGKRSHSQGSWQCDCSSPKWQVETSLVWLWTALPLSQLLVLWKSSDEQWSCRREEMEVHYIKHTIFLYVYMKHNSCPLESYILKFLSILDKLREHIFTCVKDKMIFGKSRWLVENTWILVTNLQLSLFPMLAWSHPVVWDSHQICSNPYVWWETQHTP